MVGLAAVGMTLYVSWQVEGAGAAVVNEAGKQRMRSYRLGLLLSELRHGAADGQRVAEARAVIESFDAALALLRDGDPERPMFLPRDAPVRERFARLERDWRESLRPAAIDALERPGGAGASLYAARVDGFVAEIDELVRSIEAVSASHATLLRNLQYMLIAISVVGTLALVYLSFLLVVRPVEALREGLERMRGGHWDTRLPVESRDEFGALAEGFNRMATHLEDLYDTLEQRVAEKTRNLAARNGQIAALYDAARLVNEQNGTEAMCLGFLRLAMRFSGAAAGAIRLFDARSRNNHLYLTEGLDREFIERERCLRSGDCLCGMAAQERMTVFEPVDAGSLLQTHDNCARFRCVGAFMIRHGDRLAGLFNLYFSEPRVLGAAELETLETLGRHLGLGIETERLRSCEREVAVSEERNLLAQELHDSIAQSLAFLNIQAQRLEAALARTDQPAAQQALGEIRRGVQESYDDVRELLVHFRTRVHNEDLELAIRQSAQRFEGQTGIRTRVRVAGETVELPADAQMQVLHVLQEALSNVRKHSRASSVTIDVLRGDGYRFAVRDDGRGFDAPAVAEDGHFGLRIMRERAHRIGGRLRIASRAGAGTEVTLDLPLASANDSGPRPAQPPPAALEGAAA
jgi:two-component system nitrate/nitrite sensor histidine kinase NarX